MKRAVFVAIRKSEGFTEEEADKEYDDKINILIEGIKEMDCFEYFKKLVKDRKEKMR